MVESSDDSRQHMSQLVRHLNTIGPNIAEISRLLGQPEESVRYRYREKIVKKGFDIQAAANYKALGLTRLVLLARVEDRWIQRMQDIFFAMDGHWYFMGFCKAIPEALHVFDIYCPTERMDSFLGFVRELQRRGFFNSILDFFPLSWWRNVPMRAEFYDFDTDRWDFQDAHPAPGGFRELSESTKKVKFDLTDLRIIGELQLNADRSFAKIAQKLRLNYKKLRRHYKHITDGSLINSYMIRWTGTRFNEKLGKAMQKSHRYLFIYLLASRVDESDRNALASKVASLPFVWFEGGNNNHYLAQVAVPMVHFNEVLRYLETAVSPIWNRVRYLVGDQTDALQFTIPDGMYDRHKKRWKYDVNEMLVHLDRALASSQKPMTQAGVKVARSES